MEAKNANLLHGDKRLVEECTIGNVSMLPDSIETGIIGTALKVRKNGKKK